MKKIFLSLLVVFMVLSLTVVLVKAEGESSVTLTDGVQIRTDGNNGLRWEAKVENAKEGQVYGFLFAQGELSAEQLNKDTEGVIAKEVEALKEDGTYHATMVKFPTSAVVQDISVRAYVKTGEEYIYSDNVVVRNLAEVAIKYGNSNKSGDFVNEVTKYVDSNYKKIYYNLLDNYVVDSALYEYEPENLKTEFINDWNAMFETSWSSIDGATFKTSAIIGLEDSSIALPTNIYKFFNDEFYGAKWQWLLHYLLKQSDVAVHPKRQINALLSNEGTASDSYGNGLNNFDHLSYSIANFFNQSSSQGGYTPMVFVDKAKYSTVKEYNKSVYTSYPSFVKIGSTINLPEQTPNDGYEWMGWFSNSVKYTTYTVENTDIQFESVFNILSETFEALNETTGVKYITLTEALTAASSGDKIVVQPGTYTSDYEISNKVTLTSSNGNINPTTEHSSFLGENAVIFTGRILLLSSSCSGSTISGITFTDGARVIGYGNSALSGVVFKNNYVYDTNDATIAFKSTRYGNGTTGSSTFESTYPGFISLAHSYGWVSNLTVKDNVFSNVSDINVYVVCTQGVTITGNVFDGCDRDAIRFDYNNNYGTFNIKDNKFSNIAYSGINIRSFGAGGAATINIENNTFNNVATNSTKVIGNATIGCISNAAHQEAYLVTMNVKFNSFNNCGGYINARLNCKADQFIVNVLYNSFIDDNASTVAYSSSVNSNQKGITFNHNYYGTSETEKVTPISSQYDANSLLAMDEVTYDSLEDLQTVINELE